MSKLIKLFPVAVGLAVLTGCSSDDFRDFAGKTMDLSNKYILKASVEGTSDVQNRAYWDNTNKAEGLAWGEEDVLRVYDSKLQKFDNFTYNGEFFVTDADAAITDKNEDGNIDYAYALHVEPDCFSYAGWNNGKNIALLKIGKDNVKYSEELAADGETVVYKHALPMWGSVKSTTETVQEGENAVASFTTTLLNVTPRAKVVFNYGIGANIQKVRVRSMKLAEGVNKDNTVLKGLLDNMPTTVEQEVTNLKGDGDKDVLEENTEAPLSGWFEMILDEDEPQPLRMPSMGAIVDKTAYSTTIEVDVDITDQDDYTNVVYLPITWVKELNDKYQYLLFEYQDKNDKWHFLRLRDYAALIAENKIARDVPIGVTTITAEMTCDLVKLSDINKFLANLNVDKNMVISFTKQVVSYTYDAGTSQIPMERDSTLIIPDTWSGSHKVTLNFNYGSTGSSSLIADENGVVLEANSPNGKKVKSAPVMLHNPGNATVEINVANISTPNDVARPVIVKVVENDGKVILGKNVSDIVANEGQIVVNAEGTVGDVTVAAADATTSVEVIGGTVKTLTSEGEATVTVDGATVETLTHNSTGDITVKNNGIVNNLTNNGENADIYITGTVVKLTNGEKGGKIEATQMGNASDWVDNSTADLTVSSSDGRGIYNLTTKAQNVKLTKLTTNGNLTLTGDDMNVAVEDYCVNNIACKGSAKYYSKGFSAVQGNVTVNGKAFNVEDKDSKLTFESDWNGEITKSTDINGKTVGNTYKVYTAAELALLLNDLTQDITIDLYANINLDKESAGNEWKGIFSQEDITLNGNGFAINQVNITNTAEQMTAVVNSVKDNRGWGFIRRGDNIEVSNLTLNGVNTKFGRYYDAEKDWGDGPKDGLLQAIGGLVGEQKGTGTYEKVTVNGSNIGYQYKAGETQVEKTADNFAVGGLVGLVTGSKAEVKNCTVALTGKISGTWGLGGLVGQVRGAEMEFVDNTVSLGGFDVRLALDKDEEMGRHFGQVGMFIGSLNDANCAVKITENKTTTFAGVTDCIIGHRKELKIDLCQHVKDNALYTFQGLELTGKSTKKAVYVGYSDDYDADNLRGAATETPGNLTLTGFTEKVDGTTVDAFNVFVRTKDVPTNYAKKH